jgi:excisionase family DNA binding protein
MESRFITTKDVADALQTSVSHVRRLIGAGLLNATRVGKRIWRIRQKELDRFITEMTSKNKGGKNG